MYLPYIRNRIFVLIDKRSYFILYTLGAGTSTKRGETISFGVLRSWGEGGACVGKMASGCVEKAVGVERV